MRRLAPARSTLPDLEGAADRHDVWVRRRGSGDPGELRGDRRQEPERGEADWRRRGRIVPVESPAHVLSLALRERVIDERIHIRVKTGRPNHPAQAGLARKPLSRSAPCPLTPPPSLRRPTGHRDSTMRGSWWR